MTVQFSCRCPNADYLGFETSPEAIIAVATKAETLGFDAVMANDHIIVDGSARSSVWANTYDPFVALSFMAAHTTRIGLGVSVLIVPYRNPIETAKTLATIDRMSGGRVIAGIGVGWNEAEFKALGVPFHERGARTTEYLRIWRACWTPGEVSFAGRFFSFAGMRVNPKPIQQPYLPIWAGGSSDAALRRTAAFADVWQPMAMPIADLIERQKTLAAACATIGRPVSPATRMSFRVDLTAITGNAIPSGGARPAGLGSAAEVAADLIRYRDEAGVTAFQINFHGNRDRAQLLDQMTCFMRDVKPLVG